MKRNLTLLSVLCLYLFAIEPNSASAENYTHSAVYGERSNGYYLDRKFEEAKQKDDPISAGILTRFGYAFNYDAFTYGVSIFYQWDRLCGITAGFDGYYIPNKLIYRTLPNDTVPSGTFSLPLWDVRAGFYDIALFSFRRDVRKNQYWGCY